MADPGTSQPPSLRELNPHNFFLLTSHWLVQGDGGEGGEKWLGSLYDERLKSPAVADGLDIGCERN